MLLCYKISWLCVLTIFSFLKMNAQCCAAGSGSPIAGDGSQGVLQKDQAELNLNYQNVYSTKFLSGDTADVNYLDKYSSNYLYLRLADFWRLPNTGIVVEEVFGLICIR